MTDANTDLLVTELRKAIKVEPGDYVVLLKAGHISGQEDFQLTHVAEMLWKQNIRFYFVYLEHLDAVRFVKVESPQALKVEEP